MSLIEKLTSIKTRLTNLLSDCNAALIAKGASEVTTLYDVPTAIESVQSGGGSSDGNNNVVKKVLPLTNEEIDYGEGWALEARVQRIVMVSDVSFRMYLLDLFLNYTDFSTYKEIYPLFGELYENDDKFDPDGVYGAIKVKNLNLTSAENLKEAFAYCSFIESLEHVNNTNPECKMTDICRECINLKLVTDIYFPNDATGFRDCLNLETIIIAYVGGRISARGCISLKNIEVKSDIIDNVNLADCPLTQATLHHLIEKLDNNPDGYSYNFVVGSDNIAKIDEEHIAMLENKNWNYS